MRIVIIGTPRERRELRDAVENDTAAIVGEFDSVTEARSAGVSAEAFLEAMPADGVSEDEDAGPERLTAREVEVLQLVADGLSNKSIAARLGISDQTVKFHVSSIYGKLGAVNRTDAVRRAVRRGLLTL
jgi:DNA-binding NarL/FixJ family response regulator